jgi:hypothetical protein
MLRTAALVMVATSMFAAAFAAPAHAGQVVRLAVVGATGAYEGADLQALSTRLRDELMAHVDVSTLAVVTRDEMSLVYSERGAACHTADTACIVEASAAWGGRLFVRATATPSVAGVIVSVRLDSVRGLAVAEATRTALRIEDAPQLVPALVRELLDEERAFRARAFGNAAPVKFASTIAPQASAVDDDSEKDICHCFVAGPLPRPGDLVFDGKRVAFKSTGGFGKSWEYAWTQIRRSEALFTSAYRPGIALTPNEELDFIVVYFENDYQRDRCFNAMNRRRATG